MADLRNQRMADIASAMTDFGEARPRGRECREPTLRTCQGSQPYSRTSAVNPSDADRRAAALQLAGRVGDPGQVPVWSRLKVYRGRSISPWPQVQALSGYRLRAALPRRPTRPRRPQQHPRQRFKATNTPRARATRSHTTNGC